MFFKFLLVLSLEFKTHVLLPLDVIIISVKRTERDSVRKPPESKPHSLLLLLPHFP